MAYFYEVITSYTARISTTQPRSAYAVLITANMNYYIQFHPGETGLPAPMSPVIGGRQHVYTHMTFSTYDSVIDMLRNEGPVFAMYRDDAKFGMITTSAEPVGEEERRP